MFGDARPGGRGDEDRGGGDVEVLAPSPPVPTTSTVVRRLDHDLGGHLAHHPAAAVISPMVSFLTRGR